MHAVGMYNVCVVGILPINPTMQQSYMLRLMTSMCGDVIGDNIADDMSVGIHAVER